MVRLVATRTCINGLQNLSRLGSSFFDPHLDQLPSLSIQL